MKWLYSIYRIRDLFFDDFIRVSSLSVQRLLCHLIEVAKDLEVSTGRACWGGGGGEEYFATSVLSSGLFVINDALGGGEDKETELT